MTAALAADVAIADARYGRVAYFRDDGPIGASLRAYGEWAQVELDVLLRFVRAGDTVVDVGANVGTHTLAFARAVGTDGRVVAFEPQAPVCQLLERNVRFNGFENVDVHCLALGPEHAVRYVPALDYGAHVNVGAIALLERAEEGSSAVDLVPLDAFALEAVGLIKIDVEGMECDVLRGAAETLQRCRPFLSIESNSVEAAAAVLGALRDAEYVCYMNRTPAYNAANHRGNAMNRFGASAESSVFCVPRERHAATAALCAEQSTLTPVVSPEEIARVFLGAPRESDGGELQRLRYRVAKHAHELAEADRRAAQHAERIRELEQGAPAQLAAAGAELAAAAARSADAEERAVRAEALAEAARLRAETVERRAALLAAALADAHVAALAAEQRAAQAEQRPRA